MEVDSWLIASRTSEGREYLREAEQLKILLTNHASSSTSWEIRYKHMQCLKNCVIGCEENGLYLLQAGALDLAIQHLKDLEEMKDQDITSSYCRLTLQFITNILSCHHQCVEVFWSKYGTDMISYFLSFSLSLKSDVCVAASIAILHTCISKDDNSFQVRRRQILEARQLCCQIALSILDLQYALSVCETSSGIDESLKWFHIFVLSLCLKGYAVELLKLVGKCDSSSLDAAVTLTHEQVIYLNAYVNVFEDHLFVKQTLSQIATSSCDMEHICPAVSSVNSLVSHLSETLTSSILTQLNQLDPHSTSFQVVDHIILSSVAMIPSLSQSLSIPCVPPILDCLTAILLASDEVCAGDKSARETARIRLINLYVDDICLRILAAHRRALTRKGVPSADGAYWNTLVKCCLNLLMNMCYRCSPVQDMIRTREGLPVILSYCVTDFENPLCREYALMCIRNLCEGNLENQRFIESLQPQQVLQDETLLAQGIRIEMDPLSGRFKFHHEER